MTTDDVSSMRFILQEDIQLTAARLSCAIYQRGLSAWLTYEGGRDRGQDAFEIPLFQAMGTELSHPVFCWCFQDLCNGKASVRFTVEFVLKEDNELFWEGSILPGKWTVSDGTNIYPLEWTQSKGLTLIHNSEPTRHLNMAYAG